MGFLCEVDVFAPKLVTGEFNKTSDGFERVFKNPEQALRFNFKKENFNSDYGGYIGKITVKGSRVYIATPKACIILLI
jgi:hypothetical protein